MPVLSLTIWVPIVFGIAVLVIGNDRDPAPARWTALAGSILGLLVCMPLWTQFDLGTGRHAVRRDGAVDPAAST